jgi:hypothetical protein
MVSNQAMDFDAAIELSGNAKCSISHRQHWHRGQVIMGRGNGEEAAELKLKPAKPTEERLKISTTQVSSPELSGRWWSKV